VPVRIAVHSPASAADLATVDAGLGEYNMASAPLGEVRPLHVIATDETAVVVGGAVGRTWGGCCELQQLWVCAQARGCGAGSLLLTEFERVAASRGCTLVYLDTFSFQAPAFYAKHRYVEVLRTGGFGDGVVKLSMRKALAARAAVA
jgi:GNAT superfamily N-acetyltransferase